jgi:PAS domain S-box-containing protein
VGASYQSLLEGEVPFPRRLELALDDVCGTLGLAGALVVELAAVEGCVAPLWRGRSGGLPSPPPLAMDHFRRLVDRQGVLAAGDEDLAALGPAVAGRAVTVVAVPVTPRLSALPDAAAILVHGGAAPDARMVADVRACLAQGLSADRRTRLGRAMLAAIDQAPDQIELTDREGRLIYANASWEATFGHPVAEALGSTVAQLFRDPVAPVHDTAFYQFTMSTLAAGLPWLGALARRTRDGGRVFREVNVAPFAADEQEIRGHIAVHRRIDHREERDAALAVAHSQFRAVLSAIPDGVAVIRGGAIYFANPAFLAMCQLTEAQAIGFSYIDLIHADDRERFQSEPGRAVVRVRVVGGRGATRFAEISSAGAVSFEGQPSTILISRDTTDYYLARQRLVHAEKLSALGSLAAGVAHEVNNPLAFLILNLELLQKSAAVMATPMDAEAIDEAIGGARRIRSIVAELRSFARPNGQGAREPVDVEKAATSAVNIAYNEIRHRARLVRRHEQGLFVMADEGQLVQVLVNVLVNAAQAIPASAVDDHTVSITSHRDGGDVHVVVSDSGVGIPPSMLPHVFEPFFTNKSRGEGSGLGLAISKQIIDSLAGSIYIESEPNVGTTVHVKLPAAAPEDAAAGAAAAAAALAAAGAGGGVGVGHDARPVARILIVDDEASIVRALRRGLPEHEVAVARNGIEALRFIEMSAPGFFDLVLCDLMMPGLSGADVYRRAVEARPELATRFIFMTGAALADGVAAMPDAPGLRLLEKPFDLEQVRAWVEAAMASRLSGHRQAGLGNQGRIT